MIDGATARFEAERPALTALCYRMLGERGLAEDAVQDTWLRWAASNPEEIAKPGPWLRKAATRIAIDSLRSARARREQYYGPWLPEPLLESDEQPLEAHLQQAQQCQLALLWAMERLTETERAAFVLREAFDCGYEELADVLDRSRDACRQLVSRAHKRLQEDEIRFDASSDEVHALLQSLSAAFLAGNINEVTRLLTPDAVALTDGGLHARASRRPLLGPADIIAVFTNILKRAAAEEGASLSMASANGQPCLLRTLNGRLDTVFTVAPGTDGQTAWIYVMRNPEKLTPNASRRPESRGVARP